MESTHSLELLKTNMENSPFRPTKSVIFSSRILAIKPVKSPYNDHVKDYFQEKYRFFIMIKYQILDYTGKTQLFTLYSQKHD